MFLWNAIARLRSTLLCSAAQEAVKNGLYGLMKSFSGIFRKKGGGFLSTF